MSASTQRYHSLNVSLHWLMLLLIAAVYACIELRTNFPKGSDVIAFYNTQIMLQ